MMEKKGLCIMLGILGMLLVSTAVYAADYWTGDGGKGTSLVVMEPKSNNLPSEQQYFTSMVQGHFAVTLSTYSAIAVTDRMHAEDVLKQAELQNESSVQDIGKILEVDYMLTGNITKTSTAFALTIQIIRVEGQRTVASHSANYTLLDVEDRIAVNKASLDLLGKMGITLTDLAKRELQQAASQKDIQGQTALSQGIDFQRKGDEIRSLALYNLANSIDPSLMEAANRVSILSANIRTGNIGEDRRNDIQWRNAWKARLEETERYFDTYFNKTLKQPYALIYTPLLQYGETNYRDETVPVSFTVELLERANWTDPVVKTVNTVWQGLYATGRKEAWEFENWPRYSVSNVNPFQNDSKRFTIGVELVNDKKKVVARQTFEVRGRWEFSFNQYRGIQSFTSSGQAAQTIRFPSVKADDLPDKDGSLTLNFTTVNGMPVADASRNGILMITTRSEYRDLAGFDLSGIDREGYDREGYRLGFHRDGYNKEGYDRAGFSRAGYTAAGYGRDGFNRDGYDAAGYDRSGFNRDGFNRDGSMADGSRYNTAGFDQYGYNRAGYDAAGFDRSGYNKWGRDREGYKRSGYKWTPVSSVFELLTMTSYGGGTIGLFGAYVAFPINSDDDDDNDNPDADADDASSDRSEFVIGYTVNLLPTKKSTGEILFGLGLSLGVGRNNLTDQLILETGLQVRFLAFEIRGTYRTVGSSDNSFIFSAGLCFPLGYSRMVKNLGGRR